MLSDYLPPIYFPFGEESENEQLERIYTCTECGNDILKGEDVWHLNDKPYCAKCVKAAHSFAQG